PRINLFRYKTAKQADRTQRGIAMSFARFYRTVARCAAAVLILAMQAGVSSGQIVSGSIVGTVTDASGGTIPGVKVTATNEETNLTRETLTNDSGHFAIPSLPPGRYRVAASQPGFKSAQVSGIELLIDQTARVDLKLEVGNITDQITISA